MNRPRYWLTNWRLLLLILSLLLAVNLIVDQPWKHHRQEQPDTDQRPQTESKTPASTVPGVAASVLFSFVSDCTLPLS